MCGSAAMQRETIRVQLRDGSECDLPADVCSKCGEQYLDPEAIDQFAFRKKRPARRAVR